MPPALWLALFLRAEAKRPENERKRPPRAAPVSIPRREPQPLTFGRAIGWAVHPQGRGAKITEGVQVARPLPRLNGRAVKIGAFSCSWFRIMPARTRSTAPQKTPKIGAFPRRGLLAAGAFGPCCRLFLVPLEYPTAALWVAGPMVGPPWLLRQPGLYAPALHNARVFGTLQGRRPVIAPFWPFLGDFRQFRRKYEELPIFDEQTKYGLFLACFWACLCKTWRISPIYRRATEGLTFGKVQGVQMCYICPVRRRDYRARLGERPQVGFCPRLWLGVIASGDPAGPPRPQR